MAIATSNQLRSSTSNSNSTKPTSSKMTTTSGLTDSFAVHVNNAVMDISETVEGFVDLEILAKIITTLSESMDPADIDLATWIQREYLSEPISEREDCRPIGSREGFEALGKAYRRVRSLTNRAQDKWPFFDRHWKQMPKNTVRQASHGSPILNGVIPSRNVSDSVIAAAEPQARSHSETLGTMFPTKDTTATTIEIAKLSTSPPNVRKSSRVTVPPKHKTLDILEDSTRKRRRGRNSDGTQVGNHSNGSMKQRGGLIGSGSRGNRGGRRGRGSRNGRGGSRPYLSEPTVLESDDDASDTPWLPKEQHASHKTKEQLDGSLESNSSTDISTKNSKRKSTEIYIPDVECSRTQEASQKGWKDTDSLILEEHATTATEKGSLRPNGSSTTEQSKLDTTKAATTMSSEELRLLRLGLLATSRPRPSQMLASATVAKTTNETDTAIAIQATQCTTTTSPETDVHSHHVYATPTNGLVEDSDLETMGTIKKNDSRTEGAMGSIDVDIKGLSISAIEFIARVQIDSGSLEFPIPSNFLNDTNQLSASIRRFVAWKKGEGQNVPITFNQFHGIFRLDRKSDQ